MPIVGSIPIPVAWNKGIKKARGEIILFTESDAQLPSNWIEEMVDHLKINDFILGPETRPTEPNNSMSNVGIKANLAKNHLFDESFRIGEDTKWIIDLQVNGIRPNYPLTPIVWHYKVKSFKKRLKREFLGGIKIVQIWLEYDDVIKNTTYNFKQISAISNTLSGIANFIGILFGLILYSYQLPKKILRIFRNIIG